MTCLVIYGNGYKTGMETIAAVLKPTQWDPSRALTACAEVAVTSTTKVITSGSPAASRKHQIANSMTSACDLRYSTIGEIGEVGERDLLPTSFRHHATTMDATGASCRVFFYRRSRRARRTRRSRRFLFLLKEKGFSLGFR